MESENTEQASQISYTGMGIPVAIVIAGLFIAGAIYFNNNPTEKNTPDGPVIVTPGLDQVRPVSDQDHIRGNPEAEVIIVEYSDTECPFCIRFHNTMKQIMDEYGKDGKVAWVYRHFPLTQLHPQAFKQAVALECAGELGGNLKFWEYTDRLYAVTPGNNGLADSELPKIAEYVGLDVDKFNLCLISGKHDDRVRADMENAQLTGGNGTPWSIVITKGGDKYPLNGAQPIATIKQLIDALLK